MQTRSSNIYRYILEMQILCSKLLEARMISAIVLSCLCIIPLNNARFQHYCM